MTEAQLRAAASVTAKRADDEALHSRQKLAELKQQLSSQVGVTFSSCILVSMLLLTLGVAFALCLFLLRSCLKQHEVAWKTDQRCCKFHIFPDG